MNLRILGLIIAGALASTGIGHAQVDFFFTFDGNGGVGFNSHEDPTVSGEVFGLTDNATSIPTSITVTVAPSEFGAPLTFSTSTGSYGGTFDVEGGVVQADTSFYLYDSTHTDYIQFNEGTNELWESASLHIYNSGGISSDPTVGVEFTRASSVPEPSQYGMGIFLAVAGFVGYRKFVRKSVTA